MVVRELLRVAASPEVRQDANLHRRVMRVLERVAVDVNEPQGVTPAAQSAENPVGVLEDHRELLEGVLTGHNASEQVTSALGLSTSLASAVMQVESLLGVLPTENVDPEQQPAFDALRSAFDAVLANIQDMVPFAQKLAEYVNVEKPIEEPKFPSLPRSIKPPVSTEVDKAPVVNPPTESDGETDDIDMSEIDALLGD